MSADDLVMWGARASAMQQTWRALNILLPIREQLMGTLRLNFKGQGDLYPEDDIKVEPFVFGLIGVISWR